MARVKRDLARDRRRKILLAPITLGVINAWPLVCTLLYCQITALTAGATAVIVAQGPPAIGRAAIFKPLRAPEEPFWSVVASKIVSGAVSTDGNLVD